jgi:hypothetical protein
MYYQSYSYYWMSLDDSLFLSYSCLVMYYQSYSYYWMSLDDSLFLSYSCLVMYYQSYSYYWMSLDDSLFLFLLLSSSFSCPFWRLDLLVQTSHCTFATAQREKLVLPCLGVSPLTRLGCCVFPSFLCALISSLLLVVSASITYFC